MNTNIEEVKSVAIAFLHIKPEPIGNLGNLFVTHPYLNSSAVLLPGTNELFNIFENKEKFELWKTEFENHLKTKNSVFSFLTYITNPYKLAFFKYINNFLSEEDYAKCLESCYTQTEFVSDETNVSKSELIDWFKKANKSYLMSEEDKAVFDSLPEKIEVYRGVTDSLYKYGVSWTLSLDKAKWFANRWSSKTPIIYKCIVNKQDVLAYFDDREEKEVVIDAKNLKKYKIEKVNI